jgi:hypothetical protein
VGADAVAGGHVMPTHCDVLLFGALASGLCCPTNYRPLVGWAVRFAAGRSRRAVATSLAVGTSAAIAAYGCTLGLLAVWRSFREEPFGESSIASGMSVVGAIYVAEFYRLVRKSHV